MNNIYIAQSTIPGGGRGVFARVAIKKGELIERCPVIEIPEHDSSNFQESILVTYIYYLGKNKNRLFLALGFGSLYNHSYQPNAKYQGKYKEKIIAFIATKDIRKDEEITVNYHPGSNKEKRPLWFE